MATDFDLLSIGNAIVDVIAKTDDAFLARHKLKKGAMHLTDAEAAKRLYADMGPAVEISGGSAANTAVGLAALGGRAAFIGTVADDQLGQVFRHDIRAAGIHFDTPPVAGGLPTARSFILVTPDAQRTMNTFLGACLALSEDHIDEDLVKRAKITYFEGYLWDPPEAKAAIRKAAAIAKEAGNRVALTLSDSFCVERWRGEFNDLIDNHIDILFANEEEVKALTETDSFDAAMKAMEGRVEVAALTRSEKGAVILADGEARRVDAVKTEVVDTTGAGDLFAAGFLYGLVQGRTPEMCGHMGAACAAEVISHVGARPEADLRELVREFI